MREPAAETCGYETSSQIANKMLGRSLPGLDPQPVRTTHARHRMNGRRVIASSVAKLGCSDHQPARPVAGQIKMTPPWVAGGPPPVTVWRVLRVELSTRQPNRRSTGRGRGPGVRTLTSGTWTPVEVLERSRYASRGITSCGSRYRGNLQPARPAHRCELTSNRQPHEHGQVDSLRPPSRIPCLGRYSRKRVREDEPSTRASEYSTVALRVHSNTSEASPQTNKFGATKRARVPAATPWHLCVIAWTTKSSLNRRAGPTVPKLDSNVTLSGRQGI